VSYLGIILSSVFASNALLAYGFGSIPERERKGAVTLASALALAAANALASVLLWLIRSLVLQPLGLASLDVLFFALIAVPLVKFLARMAQQGAIRQESLLFRVGERGDDIVVGSLVYGIALLSSRGGYSLGEAAAASVTSGLGYWLALFLLESVRERLELTDLPAPFRGAPAMLISAGLMALAFMGIDSAFVKGLVGA
jgi:Na+-translocating ferredoxin:NAD+ oxidoreductase subunit A